jgi:hypothetical protein
MSTKKDEVFDVEQAIVSTTAIANQTAWALDTNWMSSELVPKKTRWDAAYAAYKPESTRNKLITFEKNESRKEYEPTLQNENEFYKNVFDAGRCALHGDSVCTSYICGEYGWHSFDHQRNWRGGFANP